MTEKIPKQMKAIVRAADASKIIEVKTISVPEPGKGELIVRVEVAPINPSDESFALRVHSAHGQADFKPPVTIGFEGCGVVVALGPDTPPALLNQRVAFCTDPHGKEKWSGSWAQYICVNHSVCIPIGDLPFEDTCCIFINPMTALGFFTEVKKLNSKGFVHTAAASSLGKMLVKCCVKNGLEIINVVRRDEQTDELKKLGAKHVLNQNAPDFLAKLSELATKLGITVCFDAVSGSLTGKLLNAMPPKSTVFVYGALEGKAITDIDPRDLIFSDKKLEGFLLARSAVLSPAELPKAVGTIMEDLMKGGAVFKPKIVKKLKLEECAHHLMEHKKHPTEGKTVLLPNAK